MTNASSAALRKRRHQLVRALPPLEQIVRGSLMRPTSVAADPVVTAPTGLATAQAISVDDRSNRRTSTARLCAERTYPQVAEFLANYRKLQEMLNEICAINAELLRRRESLD